MTWQITPIALMYLLAALINLITAVINWRRRHIHKGIATISLVVFLNGVSLAGWFIEMAIIEPVYKQIMISIEDSLGGIIYVLLLFFVLDFFDIWPWFRGWWRWSLWIFSAIAAIVGLTNPLHRLYWSGYTPGPPGSNVIYFTHGPIGAIATVFFTELLTLSFILLCYKSFTSKRRERQTALFITTALAAPFFTFLTFALIPDQFSSLLAFPFGYSLTALIIDWAVMEDFRFTVNETTSGLKLSVENLKLEIIKREHLEQELRESQNFLSMQLAAQSSKLTGVYDLILVSGQMSDQYQLIQTSLVKLAALLCSQSVVFFRITHDQSLVLEASSGNGKNIGATPISSDWLPLTPDVCAELSTQQASGLPPELIQKDNDAALFKWVIVQGHPMGVLAAYWEAGYRFAVDDIALFGAMGDGLGLIVENARLRQTSANAATLQERHRLARNLHDSVTQSLHSLVLSSQTAMEETLDPVRLKRILKGLDTGARQALREMRLLLFELRLVPLDDAHLVDLLNNRLDSVEHRGGIQAELEVEPGTYWPKAWEINLYPLAIEALNNSLKHARASHVSIRFSNGEDRLLMEIRDNGLGFDLATVPPGGMGFIRMAEHCEHLGANLEIATSPSTGTSIRVRIMNIENATPNIIDKEFTNG
ncbi:MAG: histidine kinase [Chloroflexi bacterium]|nr:histidine kinase [Chloroflexota bacterium]